MRLNLRGRSAAAGMLAGCLVQAAAAPAIAAAAADYPAKPVRIVVSIPPGSGADTVSRAIAQQLGQSWGKSFIVDNRTGAGGAIAMELVTRSAPDGYTLLCASVGLAATARLLNKVSFDPVRVFDPIIELTTQPYVVIVNPQLPYRSMPALIAYARQHPGVVNYASSGTGSGSHLGTELFKSMAGVDLTRVPYKGLAQALNELAAGQVQVLFSTFISAAPFIKASKVVPIAVTTPRRLDAYPALPTVAEAGVAGFELTSAYALFAPAGTPPDIVNRLNHEITAILKLSEVRARLSADGAEVSPPNTPASFRVAFASEVARWEKLAQTPGVRDQFSGAK